MTTLTQPASKTLRVNDLALHYLEWGEADAPDIVCVHGYTGSADAFNALARRLCDRFHIIAPDVRGHGESGWSAAGAYEYADQAGDLAAFADRLELERFVLIGTSMGGIIAMAYRREMSPIVAGRNAEDQRELALGVLRQRADGRWGWKMDPAYIRQRVEHGAPRRPPLWPGLQALHCPTLVVWGTESDVLSEAQARRMVGALPQGELVRVPGIGHAPTLVEPHSLAALERLLAGLQP